MTRLQLTVRVREAIDKNQPDHQTSLGIAKADKGTTVTTEQVGVCADMSAFLSCHPTDKLGSLLDWYALTGQNQSSSSCFELCRCTPSPGPVSRKACTTLRAGWGSLWTCRRNRVQCKDPENRSKGTAGQTEPSWAWPCKPAGHETA